MVASSNSPKKEKKEKGTPISQVVVKEQMKETSRVDFSSRPGSDLNEKLILTATFCINHWSVERAGGHETLNLDFTVKLYWKDIRVKDWPSQKDLPENIWRPELMMKPFKAYKDNVAPPTIFDRKQNNCILQYILPLQVLKQNLDEDFYRLQNFPFDSIRLDTFFCFSGEKRLETAKDIDIVYDYKLNNGKKCDVVFTPLNKSGEFRVDACSYALASHASPYSGDVYNDVIFSMQISRDPTYYKWKAQFPTMAIVIISCLTFNASPDEFLGRIEIVIGMFLTSFAIQWTVMERLPPTPYLNNIDYSLVCALAIMGLIVVSHCITNRIFKAGNEELAILLDTWFMVVIVVSYIGTQIFLSLRIRKFMRGSSLRKYKESNDSMNARVTVKEAWYCDLGDEKYKDFKLRTDGSNVGKRIDVGEF